MNNDIVVLEYNINYDGIKNRHLEKLPLEIKEKIIEAYSKVATNPQFLIDEYSKIQSKYFNNPILLNYLATAYSHIGNKEKAKEISLKNYKRNKNYLFAKINYAQICLEEKDYKKIPAIFNGKFDLKTLYPKRKEFHISEFMIFNWIMGLYFFNIGNTEQAKIYYNLLKQIEPKDKQTKHLKMLIYPSFFTKWLLKQKDKYEKETLEKSNKNELLNK